jgi:amino acid transporter
MKDFDLIQHIWQKQSTSSKTSASEILKSIKSHKNTLERKQLYPGIILLIGVFILVWMTFFSNIKFRFSSTYAALAAMIIILLVQGLVNVFTYRRLSKLSVDETPKSYIHEWDNYYRFRLKAFSINLPVYFILLNASLLVCFYEIFRYDVTWKIMLSLIYIAVMLFLYFYIGKRVIRDEKNKLKSIIDELKMIQHQLEK